MANNLNSNPMYVDTAAVVLAGPSVSKIRAIQWIDDNADIADNADLDITFNTTTFHVKIQRATTPSGEGGTIYEMGSFNPGIPCGYLQVNIIDAGIVLIWRD